MDESIGELVAAEQDSASPLALLNDSEINRAIETAKKYPRDVKAFVEEAKAMATIDEETAESMFYVLKRGYGEDQTKIVGPSTRLAEIVGSCYGNLRYGSRVVDIGATHITAQGICFDVQKNISASVDVQRRITTKEGKRFSDDMIGVTANAACSIAMRNAIFKVVPMAFVNNICAAAKTAAVGNVKSLEEQRTSCLESFRKMGVDDANVLAFAGVKSAHQLTATNVAELRSVWSAVKAGEQTIEEAFGLEPSSEERPNVDPAWVKEKLNKITTNIQLDKAVAEWKETFHADDHPLIDELATEHRELINGAE